MSIAFEGEAGSIDGSVGEGGSAFTNWWLLSGETVSTLLRPRLIPFIENKHGLGRTVMFCRELATNETSRLDVAESQMTGVQRTLCIPNRSELNMFCGNAK